MWTKIVTIFSILIAFTKCEIEFPKEAFASVEKVPRIQRSVSEGVKSLGYKVIYGDDENYSVINEVVSDMEKPKTIKSQYGPRPLIKNLPAEDVKCLISDEHYCSSEMSKMKNVLIQAVKEDCAKCSNEDKIAAGKVIASVMAHNPSAWKLFLTTHTGLKRVERLLG